MKKRILIVKNRALGDAVMGLSCLQYLRSLYPDADIIYLVPSWIAPLFKDAQLHFKIVSFNLNGLNGYFNLFKTIRNLHIDHVHELHQSGRTRKIFKIFSKILGFSYTAHNHHLKKGKSKVIDQGVIKELIQRDLDGIFSFLGKRVVGDFRDFPPKLNYKVNKTNRIILGVVATRPSKMWPLNYFVELALLISEKFPEIDIRIPISSSDKDKEIKNRLIKLGINEYASFVEMQLSELGPFIASSSIYVGNDTGLKHIAAATGLKTLTLFGPEPAKEWHPYADDKNQYIILDMECRVKQAYYCDLYSCEDHSCMKKIVPSMVFKKFLTLF